LSRRRFERLAANDPLEPLTELFDMLLDSVEFVVATSRNHATEIPDDFMPSSVTAT
jgi:hypothetical protein